MSFLGSLHCLAYENYSRAKFSPAFLESTFSRFSVQFLRPQRERSSDGKRLDQLGFSGNRVARAFYRALNVEVFGEQREF